MDRVETLGGSTYRISWGGIFGGTLVTLGLWILLHTLGLAAGLTAINPDDAGSLRAAGIGTGVWSIIAPLIALFVGGLVTSRTSGVIDRGTGAIEGAVMWALTAVAGAVLLAMAMSSLVSAGARAGASAVSSAAGAVSSNAGAIGQAVGIDVNDMLQPMNQRLQQQGLPPVTSQQIQEVTRDAVGASLRQGRVDRETLVGSIVGNTQLTRAEAEQLAARIETQVGQRLNQAGGDLQRGALQAAETTGRALWGVFFALLLGLVSAVAGAFTGVSRRQRAIAEGPAEPVTPRPIVTGETRRVPVTPSRPPTRPLR